MGSCGRQIQAAAAASPFSVSASAGGLGYQDLLSLPHLREPQPCAGTESETLPAHLSGWCASVVNVRCQLRLSFRCGARRPWPEGLVAPWNFSSDLGLQFFFSASLWPTTLLLYPWLSTLFSFFLPLPWLLVFLCFPFPALPPHSGAIHLPLLTTEAVMAASICHCCLSCSCCCDYQNHGCFCLHGCGSQDCHCYHPAAAAAAAAAAATIDPLLS